MTYQFGKAVSGGTPVDADELRAMKAARLREIYTRLQRPPPTEDVLDQRLAEELDHAERLLAMTERELTRRGGTPQAARQVADAREVVADVAGIVGVQDRCEGLARASTATRRRLTRDVGADEEPICRPNRLRRRD